jgi:hypothetical protein
MKKFSIIHVPLFSFFSGELYRDVGLNWKGVGFGYLFLLLVICTVPRMFKFQKGLSSFIDKEAPQYVSQVPKITIEKGEVHIDEQQPYYITIPDNNKIIAIIDTTGQIQSLDNTEAFVLLTRTKLVSRQSKSETRIYNLANVQHFVLEQSTIMKWLDISKKLLVPILYPIVVAGFFIFRVIQALIYAAIGYIFDRWCKTKLSYSALIRLAVTAVTPCIIVGTIFEYASVKFPFAGFWFFLAAVGFLFYGVRACSQITGPDAAEDELESGNQNQSQDY